MLLAVVLVFAVIAVMTGGLVVRGIRRRQLAAAERRRRLDPHNVALERWLRSGDPEDLKKVADTVKEEES